jgi:hypothetical protein
MAFLVRTDALLIMRSHTRYVRLTVQSLNQPQWVACLCCTTQDSNLSIECERCCSIEATLTKNQDHVVTQVVEDRTTAAEILGGKERRELQNHHGLRLETTCVSRPIPTRLFRDAIEGVNSQDEYGTIVRITNHKTILCYPLKHRTRSKRRNVGCRESECNQNHAVGKSILKLSVSRDDSVAERRISKITVAMADKASTTKRDIG